MEVAEIAGPCKRVLMRFANGPVGVRQFQRNFVSSEQGQTWLDKPNQRFLTSTLPVVLSIRIHYGFLFAGDERARLGRQASLPGVEQKAPRVARSIEGLRED